MSRLGVGVIGAGSIADMHLAAYAANPRVQLAGVYDLNQDRAAQKAETFGVARSHPTLDSLLADPDVDAVSVCTWNDSHAEIATAALDAGKHVLVEKPLSRTVVEADALVAAVERNDRHLEVGFVRRFGANARVLKSFVDDGLLGPVYHARATNIRRLGNPGGWFADSGRSGGGPLIDIGVHVLDLCWYFMGTPKAVTVSAVTHNRLGNRANVTSLSRYKVADYDPSRNDVEDFAAALVRFDNGASLTLETSYSLHALEDRLEVAVFGERGGAQLEPKLRIATELADTMLNVDPQIDHLSFDFAAGFAAEIDHFVALCLGGAEQVAPVWHGAEVMRMLSGVYESARTGREVRLD
ncbi:Gfo/Idh/MocA family oxidoreductase [Micromonospora sp. WMMD882]|uniref:Gfo/Idh/MocA family protein n=1 Tax=Micromonospora sp. WMMD882 TaxID=3015151 RepID=UPI00248C6F9F|nr:Gfo/Idh/MocA family oxidoreductase [Micromonospora sp. WMMD882]WBB79884.1 Gfo/Idh/MocA family oxidoreductase [Micromonospora sp. WMMD882]